MFHTEDMPDSDHPLNLDLVDQEQYYCQAELLRLYNHGTITEKEFATKLAELKKLLKVMYDGIRDLYNLTDITNKE